MRILLTGGAGCLGSNLIDAWLPRGHEILVIDNFATGRREVASAKPNLTVVEGTVADRDVVDRAFDIFRPSHVVHAAAAYKDPANWREDVATNITGTINVVEAARRLGVKRFINLQTALCYGRPERLPIPVDHPTRPVTSYGISKTAGEAYVALSDLSWASLRLANIAGPYLAIGPIPTFYQRLKSGRACFCTPAVRDFLDISDFLAVMEIVMGDKAPIGLFNISTGEGHSIKERFDLVAAHLGNPPAEPVQIQPLGGDDIPHVVLDPSQARSALGWEARIGFAETVRRMLGWYDAHGVAAIYSHLRPQPPAPAVS